MSDFVIEKGVLRRYEGNDSVVIIPDSVTKIDHDAFYNCSEITIHAPKGSCAEQYAKDNNIKFEEI